LRTEQIEKVNIFEYFQHLHEEFFLFLYIANF